MYILIFNFILDPFTVTVKILLYMYRLIIPCTQHITWLRDICTWLFVSFFKNCALWNLQAFVPVSYTHLDVYKRQAHPPIGKSNFPIWFLVRFSDRTLCNSFDAVLSESLDTFNTGNHFLIAYFYVWDSVICVLTSSFIFLLHVCYIYNVNHTIAVRLESIKTVKHRKGMKLIEKKKYKMKQEICKSVYIK